MLRCGDIEIEIEPLGIDRIEQKAKWAYKATLDGAVIAEGCDLRTYMAANEKGAAGCLLGFLTDSDGSLLDHVDWRNEPLGIEFRFVYT